MPETSRECVVNLLDDASFTVPVKVRWGERKVEREREREREELIYMYLNSSKYAILCAS